MMNEIKQQARDIARESSTIEEKELSTKAIGLSQSELDNMPDDARAIWAAAWEKELERREGMLEENERKYEAAKVNIFMDEDGNIKERVVLGKHYWSGGENHVKFNAFGYDQLPPDIQEAYGEREDVVDHWIVISKNAYDMEYAYYEYAYKDNEGYDSWEEYRDAKGLGPKEEVSEKVTISKAQDVDDISEPKETPAVEQDESPERRK